MCWNDDFIQNLLSTRIPWILLLSFGQEKDNKNDVENGKLKKEEKNMAQSVPKEESE